MNDGKTKSAAKYFTRVKLDHVLYTDNFTAGNECVGCGHCAKICPARAIQIEGKRPTWVKSQCFMCFGCLRLCPTEAIRYGSLTAAEHKKLHPPEPKRKVYTPV